MSAPPAEVKRGFTQRMLGSIEVLGNKVPHPALMFFGLCIFVWPQATALSLIWLIGFYAILGGLLGIALAFRLRKHAV